MTTGNHSTNTFEDTAEWWEHYGFICDPFSVELDTHYTPQHWFQQLDMLESFLSREQPFVIIDGSQGVGKTTFAKQYVKDAIENKVLCWVEAKEATTIDDIIQQALVCLPKVQADYYPHQDAESQLFDTVRKVGQPLLLLIDDANRLSPAVLRALAQWKHHMQESIIELVLVIDNIEAEGVRVLIQANQSSNNFGLIQLLPFTQEDIENYLEQRFSRAGLTEDWPFSEQDITHILEWSQGIPGRINNVAKQLLLTNIADDEQQEEKKTWRMPRNKIIGGGLLFVLFVTVFYSWQSRLDTSHEQVVSLNLPNQAEVIPLKSRVEFTQPENVPTQPSVGELTQIEESNEVEHTIDEPFYFTEAEPILPIQAAKAVEEKTVVATSQVAEVQPRLTTSGEAYLLNLPEHEYTLQLVGGRDERFVKKFIQENNISRDAYIFKTELNGNPWYVVVYGRYQNASQARGALAMLSDELRANNPYPRAIGNIQRAIRERS